MLSSLPGILKALWTDKNQPKYSYCAPETTLASFKTMAVVDSDEWYIAAVLHKLLWYLSTDVAANHGCCGQ